MLMVFFKTIHDKSESDVSSFILPVPYVLSMDILDNKL